MPVPVSLTVALAEPYRDFTLERELEGVRQQVEHDALPMRFVDVSRLGQRRAVHHQLQPRAVYHGAKRAGDARRQRGEVGRYERQLEPARLDA
jgi:hypothetical protein